MVVVIQPEQAVSGCFGVFLHLRGINSTAKNTVFAQNQPTPYRTKNTRQNHFWWASFEVFTLFLVISGGFR